MSAPAPVHYVMSQPSPGPTIVSYSQSAGQPVRQNGYFSPNQCGHVKRMGITQVVMGILLFIFGTTITILTNNNYDVSSTSGYIGSGIWIGVLYMVTGILGIAASSKNQSGLVVGCMVMNIISTVGSLVLLSTSTTSFNNCRSSYRCKRSSEANGVLVLDALSLFMSLIQFGITIAISVICCGAMCCRRVIQRGVIQRNPNMIVCQVSGAPQQPGNLYPYPMGQSIPYSGVQPQQPPNYSVHPPQAVNLAPQAFFPAPPYSSNSVPPPAGVHRQAQANNDQKPPAYQQ